MARMKGNGHCHSFNGDGKMDIMARDDVTGELFVFPHTGKYRGAATFGEPVLIGKDFHWQRDHFLVRTIDINGTGRAQVLGMSMRPVNDNPGIFLYPNRHGLNGLDTLGEPIRISGSRDDKKWETLGIADIDLDGCEDMFGREQDAGNVDAFFNRRAVVENDTYDKSEVRMVTVDVTDFPFAMTDVTGNGRPDLLVRRGNGDLDVYRFNIDESGEGPWFRGAGQWFTIGHGWDQFEIMTVTDIDLDGRPDLLGLRADGTLVVHRHRGTFDPARPLDTFGPPEVLFTGWQNFSVVS